MFLKFKVGNTSEVHRRVASVTSLDLLEKKNTVQTDGPNILFLQHFFFSIRVLLQFLYKPSTELKEYIFEFCSSSCVAQSIDHSPCIYKGRVLGSSPCLVVQTIKHSCTDFMLTDYVSCSSVCYISFNFNFIFFSARAFKTICLKHGNNKIICSKRSCANGCERCLYNAYCIVCRFLMADFDETLCACENDKSRNIGL